VTERSGAPALRFLTAEEHAVLAAAADVVIPPLEEDGRRHPGAAALGVADYVDGLLGAFTYDPPRIWAGGPFSGRAGGTASFETFLPLGRLEELAWRTRIEGSQGLPDRERNGPVVGWQQEYRTGLAALGADFLDVSPAEREPRVRAQRDFARLLYEHACEGAYGAPEYGGNRDLAGWEAIAFPGDAQPRGYTDDEVSGRA
jgi:Gluconate 2-dehydrogenase subunit 3